MIKKFTLLLSVAFCLLSYNVLQAQTIITQWNFNSNPPDGMTGTGTTTPAIGTGIISLSGGTTAAFNSGDANGGSSDPATGDDSGYGVTTFPAQSTNEKTAGLQFRTSTVGFTNIIVNYDLRHSNTSARNEQLQYTLDVTATTPVWVDFLQFIGAAGDTWFNNRTADFTSITGLNNNPNAGFRVVSAFAPSTTSYAASNTSSTYAGGGTGGTWRFDMVTVRGTAAGGDMVAPVAQNYIVTSNTTSYVVFNEPLSSASATNVANYSFNPALTVSAATLSATGDTVFLTHTPIVNGQTFLLTVSGVQDVALNTMASTNFTRIFNSTIPNVVITEIIHSPNDIESIEIYNAGATAVNLGGLRFTDGTGGNFPEITLAAGATTTFATAPTTAQTSLNISPIYLITAGLGSATDILVIRNSLNNVVDSVQYFVGTNGWPSMGAGSPYGYSIELNAAANDNNVGANWVAIPNTVEPTPAVGIIRATPGVYPTPPIVSANGTVSFVGIKRSVNETTTTVNIVANLQNGGASSSSADIEVIALGTATSGSDFTLPASLQFNWAANANNVNDTIVVTINNDALPENAEYFIVRLVNPVNVTLPTAATNHFTTMIVDNDITAPAASQSISLQYINSFSNGAANSNSAEIVAHDPTTQRLFIANSIGAKIDIVNFSNPSAATLISSISVTPYGNINSIAVRNGIVAVAIENSTPEADGKIVFFDTNGAFISQVNAGALPDMITFSKDGTKVLTANEGQPNNAYTIDPEGSVTIVDISGGVAAVTQANVSQVSFANFNPELTNLRTAGVRIFGANNPTVAQDLEPEYIAFSDDGLTAYVTCQENNAIAVIDIATATTTSIRPLGLKDHSTTSNSLDISDQGGVVEIANWPVKGVLMPDAIASYNVGTETYLVTANEGDAREYAGLTEVVRASAATYILDPVKFPFADALKANIGRVNVTTASGDTDGDGDFDEIHVFGGRSISIFNASTGALVWDSKNDMELITSKDPTFGPLFNASNANNTFKNRSDDKGPEPEGVTTAVIAGKTYAFVALERIGGCMVYDVTNPNNPIFVDYKNTRNTAAFGGDNGAEGIIYISAANSPTAQPIVILANEISSTLSFFSVTTSVLDIALEKISAVNTGATNQVNWKTASEDAGDIFEIERSKNGINFEYITTQKANGFASSYSYTDNNPYNGITFYRLKIKDASGKISYSQIVNAAVKTNVFSVQVYPNPVSNVLTIKTTNLFTNTNATLINMQGAIVKKILLTNVNTNVSLGDLPAGIYTLQLNNSNATESIKITKQ